MSEDLENVKDLPLINRLNLLETEKKNLEKTKNSLELELSRLREDNFLNTTYSVFDNGESSKELELLKLKLMTKDDENKETERKSILSTSEQKREINYLQKKLNYYEKSLEDSRNKEKELQKQIKILKKENFSETNKLNIKYETENKTLELKCKEFHEKFLESEVITFISY